MGSQVVAPTRLNVLLQEPSIRSKFEQVLGKNAAGFISSIISAVSTNPALSRCEPMSIISSAAIAASLNLPINPSLGFSYIVPYGDKAQFQIGWKGLVQLAMRSSQYKTLNVAKVPEGGIKSHNTITGEMEFNSGVESEKTIGYVLYFKLLNGFEKYFYMSREACEAHGKKFSKSYGTGQWTKDFDSMALKTVAKNGLSKYGILSVAMQQAIEKDQATVAEDGTIAYPDTTTEEAPAPVVVKSSSRLTAAIEASNEQPAEVVPDTEEDKAAMDMDKEFADRLAREREKRN